MLQPSAPLFFGHTVRRIFRWNECTER